MTDLYPFYHLLAAAGVLLAAVWVFQFWKRRRKKKSQAELRASHDMLRELIYRHDHYRDKGFEPLDADELTRIICWKKRPTKRLLQKLDKEGFLVMVPGEKSNGIRTADTFRINPNDLETLRSYL